MVTHNENRIYIFFKYFSFFLIPIYLDAQVEKKIPDDKYGIAYDAVFENMHYNQPFRPQIHYTPITGQIADATGLILYKGTYHIFYMYDEWSRRRKFNKSWGHAVSHDLIFWEQRPQILNTRLDNAPGSGSGIVDWNNTLGLQRGVEKTLAVFYTDYGRGTSISFSQDGGNTWIRHKNNPVIPMPEGRADRDAKVFWYKPDQSWRLVLYEPPGFSFYKSTNLLKWEKISEIEGFHECPDFIEISVDGNDNVKKWVLVDGNGQYRIGDFDGTHFKSQMGNTTVNYGSGYATQTWSHSYEGDGPFYQMSFIDEKETHDRTWSQQQSFPVELELNIIDGELKLCRTPVNAIKQLRYDHKTWLDVKVRPGVNPLKGIEGDVFEIIAEIKPNKASEFGFDIRGEKISYNVKDQTVSHRGAMDHKELYNRPARKMEKVSLSMDENSMVKIHLIIDRSSIEAYFNRGEVSLTEKFYPEENNRIISFYSKGGNSVIKAMDLYRLESIWLGREQELGYYRNQ